MEVVEELSTPFNFVNTGLSDSESIWQVQQELTLPGQDTEAGRAAHQQIHNFLIPTSQIPCGAIEAIEINSFNIELTLKEAHLAHTAKNRTTFIHQTE